MPLSRIFWVFFTEDVWLEVAVKRKDEKKPSI
jgi:hypothetical protein